MSNLLSSKGYVNASAPFSLTEYPAMYKNPNYLPWGFKQYVDFSVINECNTSCQLPIFWQDDGTIQPIMGHDSCYKSNFDQYGDMDAFGLHPAWQHQLSKFASVQDCLHEWKPSVMDKLTTFSCMTITALDIDAIRVDKSTQLTINGLTAWASATHACTTNLGKKNFYITGEVTGSDTFGSLYLSVTISLTIDTN
ncbi:hypothetical protein BDR06DRAFT_1007669 [Suillus hirtellus]|nr:hypothetical protein BDR06DRAFT_1007669 [Suillus hirtellus]